MSRLGERLTMLRINASAPSRAAVGRDRVACRALHAAMDRDHFLEVAVAAVKSVPFPITPRVASYGARRAADYIAERAAPRPCAARGITTTKEVLLLAGCDLNERPTESTWFTRLGR